MEKALEDIVKHFLRHETKSSQFEQQEQQTESHNIRSDEQQQEEEVKHESPSKEIKSDQMSLDQDEFVQNLYSCLAERGVLREVHAFLRQRLVEILKGSWPHLVVSGSSSAASLNTTAIKLIEDFLCCHKLLFTFSVLVTELNVTNYTFKQDFGKMICMDAENVLVDLNIKKDTELSRKILKLYFEKDRTSLLECIIGVSSWGQCMDQVLPEWPFMIPGDGVHNNRNNHDLYMENQEKGFPSVFDNKQFTTTDDTNKDYFNNNNQHHDVDECIAKQRNLIGQPSNIGVDSKFLQLQLEMEKDKQVQIKLAIQKFREEEARKLRDEIETRLKFEMIAKEKELLRNYEDRVSHMKNLLEREKDIWFAEKSRKEKELFTQRQDLVKLMEHVKEKKLKLKEALENIEQRKETTTRKSVTTGVNASKLTDSSVGSEADTSNTSDSKETDMKHFKLETMIKRLQEENKRLQRKLLQQQPSNNVKQYQQDHSLNSVKSTIDDDKIAFLQYTVEKQAEELQQLKLQLKSDWNGTNSHRQYKVLHSKDSISSPFPLDPSTSSLLGEVSRNKIGQGGITRGKTNDAKHQKEEEEKEDIDLETFLAESKRRFADIEKKAETVGMSLREVFSKRIAKTRTPVDTTLSKNDQNYFGFSANTNDSNLPPSVPKIPSTLKKSVTGVTTHPQTLSILAPRFMSTTSSSIDQALKSFLMNQTDDPFHSSVLVKPPSGSPSNHVKFLEPNQRYTKLQKSSTTFITSQTNDRQNSQTPIKINQNSRVQGEEYVFQSPLNNDSLSKSNNENENWQKMPLTNRLQISDSELESDEKFKNLNVIIESIDELVQRKSLLPPTLSTATTSTTTIASKEQPVLPQNTVIQQEKNNVETKFKSPSENSINNSVLYAHNKMNEESPGTLNAVVNGIKHENQLPTNKGYPTSINELVVASSKHQNMEIEVTAESKIEKSKGIETSNFIEASQEVYTKTESLTNTVPMIESVRVETPSHFKNQEAKSIKADEGSTHYQSDKVKDPKESLEATASSSGALIQYKVPSPDNSESSYLKKMAKLPETKKPESWGEILSKGKPITTTKSSSTSPSISVAPDDDFMAEEDFWAL